MNTINNILGFLEKVLVFVAGILMILIMLLTTFDLLARKFLNFSIPSLYEFTEDYLMVGLVFLTISFVYAAGGHVRVTLFEKFFNPRFKATWQKVHQLLSLALFFFIGLKGWEAAVRAYQYHEVANSVLAYPLAPALFLVPVGSAMVCLRIIQALFGQLKLLDPHENPDAD
jgi:TRAP-type C4-dicarboxylate transport system permease small subunit